MGAHLRFSLAVFTALLTLTLLAGAAAGWLPPDLRGSHSAYIAALQPHLVDRFFQWDAPWYERLATDGYAWNPADSRHEQTVAFFPLWPLLLRCVTLMGVDPPARRWCVVLIAAAIAAGSIHAFHRLARALLAPGPARLATLFYAAWPAALFLLQSYPTGLINLLTILGLHALLNQRPARAAMFSCVATAGGPLAVALAATVCAALAARAVKLRALARLLPLGLLGLLAVGGLAAFVVYQAFSFGDPLAFVEAQDAWGHPWPLGARIVRFLAMWLLLPELVEAARGLASAAVLTRAHDLWLAQVRAENALNLLGLAAALLLLPAVRRLGNAWLTLHTVLTLGLYIWFVAAEQDGWATLRLIYPAVGVFLALGATLHTRPRAAASVLATFVVLLATQAFLMAAGYGVI